MSIKPTPAAYVLALTLRKVWNAFQDQNEAIREYNQKIAIIREEFAKENLPMIVEEYPETEGVFWSMVTNQLKEAAKIENTLTMVADADYRNILSNALNRPWQKTRKTKGFAALVPVLETVRRYGAIDENQSMEMDEEMARMTSEMIWYEETKDFEKGVDPIHQQIISKKINAELAEYNVKYLGEEIIRVEFDDAALDAYTAEHEDIIKEVFCTGLDSAAKIFGYDNTEKSVDRQFHTVRQNIAMYNSMLGKEMDNETLDKNTCNIITAFDALYLVLRE